MIQITQIKLPVDHTKEELDAAVGRVLRIPKEKNLVYRIIKRSIDARRGRILSYIYTVELNLKEEEKLAGRLKNPTVSVVKPMVYQFQASGREELIHRPVVVGSGPAGLLCAYQLAEYGYQPILIERGDTVKKREQKVNQFWRGEELDPESNVQFGEGGAGTFSDGKLNTMVKDTNGRIQKILELFVKHGAPEDILYLNKPHIGTDKLKEMVKSMREEILAKGGEIRFRNRLTDIQIENDRIVSIDVLSQEEKGKEKIFEIPCEILILAIGHSARDTFERLNRLGIQMEKKAFAVGLRIEHKQDFISRSQFGEAYKKLPAADYKLAHQCQNGRGVYSFCMCPGGYVVNASSESGHLVVNGMSNYARNGENANSAIIATVTPEDYQTIPGAIDSPLAGVNFQRYYEALAYQAAAGRIPVQQYGDLLSRKKSDTIGQITPNLKGAYGFANLNDCLPEYVISSIIEGIQAFDKRIPGFSNRESILSGIEMRTSSPVRIVRGVDFLSSLGGLYPCGEGAGYAGGIMSAAVDGIKVFEAIAGVFARPS